MFKERKSSLRKNMVFLVCVAFIFMIFPEVTQAATKPSYERFPFPEESISLISAVFSFVGLNLSHLGYDLAFFYSQSRRDKTKLPKQAKKGSGKKSGNKQNSSLKSNGNSTSKKPPESKDDD